MTAPLTYLAVGTEGKLQSRTGWPTLAAGLVVSRGDEVGGKTCCDAACWRLVHLRSGCIVARRMTSPEQAGYLAEELTLRTDWTKTAEEVNGLPLAHRRAMAEAVKRAGGTLGVRDTRERTPLERDVEQGNTALVTDGRSGR